VRPVRLIHVKRNPKRAIARRLSLPAADLSIHISPAIEKFDLYHF
jgi:hypothetical protein